METPRAATEWRGDGGGMGASCARTTRRARGAREGGIVEIGGGRMRTSPNYPLPACANCAAPFSPPVSSSPIAGGGMVVRNSRPLKDSRKRATVSSVA